MSNVSMEEGRRRGREREGDPPLENTHCMLSILPNPNIGSIRAITFFSKGTTSPTNGGHNNQSCARIYTLYTYKYQCRQGVRKGEGGRKEEEEEHYILPLLVASCPSEDNERRS